MIVVLTYYIVMRAYARSNLPRILVVTTMKDRIGYVQLLAQSFEFLRIYDTADVHIFDDGSSMFNVSDLKRWFPRASISEIQHSQADRSARNAFEYFVQNSTHDVIVSLDSDGLLHPSWASFIYSTLPTSDGVLSLYNSALHPNLSCNQKTCLKASTGALGMVFARKIITQLLLDPIVSNADLFDWALVHKLGELGIKFVVPRDSLILHYGMYGAHGTGDHSERENSFDMHAYPPQLKKDVVAFLRGKNPSAPLRDI